MNEIEKLIENYRSWLSDKTALRQLNDWVEVTTPYLDRHNDYIQIYVKPLNGGYLLTDDGYIVEDLETSGCKLDSPKRQVLLKTTLNGFGVKLNEHALEVHATPENFALRKHNLIQAMLAVNDMFFLATPIVSNLFHEDVQLWLENNEIRYTPNVKFSGASGFDHMFDFVIPKSRTEPERIINAINNPNKDQALAAAFAWVDTKEARPADAIAYALLNDSEKRTSPSVFDALENYGIHPVPWSSRDQVRSELLN